MKRTILCVSVFLLFSSVLSAQTKNEPSASERKACAGLAGAREAPWSVKSAEFQVPPFTVSARGGSQNKITVDVPFCRVAGTVKPTAESDIQFELWLPPRADWNSRFEGVGNGSLRGAIEYQRLMQALVRGYATVSTDNGHQSSGFDVSWALGRPERVIDFGYRAQHTVTQAAKALTRRYYGRAPQHSYFVGCSQGGHHGLMEAQRFPEDYDGIIAGAPVYNWAGEMAEQAWNVRALQRTPTGALPKQKLQILYDAVVKACGSPDGSVADPRQCSFDPAGLQCTTAIENSCLSESEIEAVGQMYEGPKTSTGIQLYPGLSRGSEIQWGLLWSDPKHLGGSWLGFYQFMVFENSGWDLSLMNFDHDYALAKNKLGKILDPDNPDLVRFADRGGKIIVYHGWADGMLPSQVSTNYYASVTAALGSARVKEFYRLFMIPGMGHCSAGPDVLFRSENTTAVSLEPDRDMLVALEQWVEHGRAPNSFVTSRLGKDGAIERTRLVCSYPTVAKYRSEGDPTRAESFACALK
jgi:pimeloyl-ACP methyl ester carboxylesterase